MGGCHRHGTGFPQTRGLAAVFHARVGALFFFACFLGLHALLPAERSAIRARGQRDGRARGSKRRGGLVRRGLARLPAALHAAAARGDARGAAERVDRFVVALVQGAEQLDRGRRELRRLCERRDQPEARREKVGGKSRRRRAARAAASCSRTAPCSSSSSSRRTSRGSSTSGPRRRASSAASLRSRSSRTTGRSRAPTRGCGRRRSRLWRPRTGAPSSRARRRPRRA